MLAVSFTQNFYVQSTFFCERGIIYHFTQFPLFIRSSIHPVTFLTAYSSLDINIFRGGRQQIIFSIWTYGRVGFCIKKYSWFLPLSRHRCSHKKLNIFNFRMKINFQKKKIIFEIILHWWQTILISHIFSIWTEYIFFMI